MPKLTVSFLQASGSVPLTKSFRRQHKHFALVRSYPHVASFTSHSVLITTIDKLATEIQRHADVGMCMLKGELQHELVNESRARSTDSTVPTSLLCLDVDGLGDTTIEQFLSMLPAAFSNTSYVYQYSASHKLLEKGGLRVHLFYLLRTPIQPNVLKDYLRWLNLSIKQLRERITLSQARSVCTFPLDITVAQNDKLLYVAPPVFTDNSVDPLKKRIGFVKRKEASLQLNITKVDPERDKADLLTIFNTLRKEAGLPLRRKLDTTMTKSGISYLKNPGQAQITEMREERGFVYFNLNGGNSWAYYHPIGNHQILYNFKGEPNYQIKEILPDYYADVTRSAIATGSVHDEQAGIHYFGFLDPKTDVYWRGQYDEVLDILTAHSASNATKITHFLKAHGQHVGDFIPEWRASYDFTSDEQFNAEDRRINLFSRSPFLRTSKTQTSPPRTIELVIAHVMGNNKEFIHYFHNWFGFIFRERKRTGTAQVWWGRQGTGKGVLFHDIMTPMIGAPYVAMVAGLTAFEKEFNGFIESSLLCLCNEVQLSELKRKSTAMAMIKQIITDGYVPIRRMRTDTYTAENSCNLVFASNKHDPIEVDEDDRRFTVAPRQEAKLLDVVSRAQIRSIPSELEAYAAYLKHLDLDEDLANTPLESEHSKALKTLSQDASVQVANALLQGDLDFFWEYRPDREDPSIVLQKFPHASLPLYNEVLYEFFQHLGTSSVIPRAYLELLFYYVCGVSCATTHKFTQFLKHKHLTVVPIRHNKQLVRGLKNIVWHASAEVRQEMTKHFATSKTRVKKKA